MAAAAFLSQSVWLTAAFVAFGPFAGVVQAGPVLDTNAPTEQFLDLQKAVEIALQHNFGVAVRRLEVATAEQDVQVARAAFEPVFTANARRDTDAEIGGFSAGDFTGYSAAVGAKTITGATVSLSANASKRTGDFFFSDQESYGSDLHLGLRQPLLRGGGIRYNRSPVLLGRLAVSDADFDLRRGILDLLRNVEIAYWEVIFAYRDKAVREETVSVAQRLLDETQARGDVGLTTGLEPLQAEAALVARLEAVIISKKGIEDRTDRLLQLLGKLGEAKFRVVQPGELPIVEQPVITDAETDRLIQKLPDYRQFESVLQRRKVLLERARNEALPTVDVTLGGGYTGYGTGYSNAFSQAFGNDQQDWQALLEMRIPLGFRGERATLAKRRYELQIDELRRREFEQSLRAQIREASRAVVTANERVRVTATSLQLSTRQLEQLRAKFREGLAPFREMLLVQDDLQEASLRAVRAKLDAVEARIRLARFDGTLLARHQLLWPESDTDARERRR